MEIPATWTGTEGHYLHGPTVPEHVRASLADLICELEAAQVDGLDSRRNEFRDSCRVTDTGRTLADLSERMRVERRILEMRFELLVAVQVQRAGVLVRMRADTPDFDCRYRGLEFGVEATTRARPEVASALHGFLEAGLYEGPDVQVVLNRTSERLYTKSPEEIRRVAERILAQIEANQSAARSPYSIPVPELRLTASVWPGCGIGPGLRVAYQAMHTLDDGAWEHHRRLASMQIRDKVKEKARKTYDKPSIVVLDVSRLGEVGRSDDAAWTEALTAELHACDLGSVGGVLVVRTVLTSRAIVPLAWRGEPDLLQAAGAVLGGEQLRPSVRRPSRT
jgi:hypothetical protein